MLPRRTFLATALPALLKSQTHVEALRASLTGRLILPSDSDYDALRKLPSFNPTTDKHPQLIVRCATPSDVVRAVLFGRDHDLEVAVRSGGHDVMGASTCDGMVIDTAPLQAITVDPERRTARVQAGVRGGQLNAAAQRHGLAAALGCHPGVGVAGLTLGGGLGWLSGSHGAACDHVPGADLVTADGKTLRASQTENPDLFWALHGGGGNFGIVTAFDFQLHPINQVLGGVLVFRADPARFLRFYRQFMQAAPDALAVEISVIAAKPAVMVALVCWSGDAAEGERVLRPLRWFDTPLADWVDRVPYARLTDRVPEVASLLGHAPPPPPRGPAYSHWKGCSLRELSGASADQLAAAIEQAPGGSSLGLGHYMHGRICRTNRASTPLIRTRGQVTCFFNTAWADPRLAGANMEWVDRSWTAMSRHSAKGAYINYLSSADPNAVQSSYGPNYARLVQIKRRFDPTNFFHLNRNIP